MTIVAIDPGNVESAYVLMDEEYRPLDCSKVENERLHRLLSPSNQLFSANVTVIEMVASYGMAVGKEVFETVFWIGRFFETSRSNRKDRLYRMDVKNNICHDSRAKDSNIRQALIDRFGEVGTKKNPGWFYGFKADIWAAYAVGVTWLDIQNGRYSPKK